MISILFSAQFLQVFFLNMNGSSLIDEETIALLVTGMILVHIFAVVAYVGRVNWLRYVCGVLYLPVILITLMLTALESSFFILLLAVASFYFFMIIRRRGVPVSEERSGQGQPADESEV